MNKPKLQEHNTDLSTILSAIGDLPIKALVEAAAREGQFVWKKYSLIDKQYSNLHFDLKSKVDNKAKVSGLPEEIYPYITESFFQDFRYYNNSYPAFTYENNTLFYAPWSSNEKRAVTYDTNTRLFDYNMGNMSSNFSVLDSSKVWVFPESGAKGKGDFISLVISDKVGAYPDGGEKDGYWYEMVKELDLARIFGYSKYAIDKFALSSTKSPITINHSLGELPKHVEIITPIEKVTESKVTRIITRRNEYYPDISSPYFITMYNNGGKERSDSTSRNMNCTNQVISLPDMTYKCEIGVEYTLITMA